MLSKFVENILFSIAFIIIISGCFDCGTSAKMVKKIAVFGGTGMTGQSKRILSYFLLLLSKQGRIEEKLIRLYIFSRCNRICIAKR